MALFSDLPEQIQMQIQFDGAEIRENKYFGHTRFHVPAGKQGVSDKRDTGEVLRKYGVEFQLNLFQRHTTVPTRHWGVFQECPRDTKGVFQVSHKHREECPRDTGECSKSDRETQGNVPRMSQRHKGNVPSVPQTQGSVPRVSQRHRGEFHECPRNRGVYQ